MVKKYYWTRKEENKLLELLKKGITNMEVLAKELDRKPLGVKRKLQRMGVVVGKPKLQKRTTTAIESKDLFTHEEALKVLAGALETLRKTGQDRLELQRARVLIDAVQTYDSLLEKFERWTEIESRLLEMDKRIAELHKARKMNAR